MRTEAYPDLSHVDVEFPEFENNEVNNLRLLLADSRKRIRRLERELDRVNMLYLRPGITDCGYDSHAALDYVAKLITPSSESNQNERQLAAEQLLKAFVCDEQTEDLVAACSVMRLVSALIGSKNVDAWLRKYPPKKHGVVSKVFRTLGGAE